MPAILAHGALGIWDEIIYISIAAIFVVFMGISWVRSRNQPPDDDLPDSAPADSTPDHFKLD
ncbi:MAG: hypothetical protein CL610_27660 [Anaerolineaceae bacterium]|nr:hypothetical protein [Anaerolineaceae bacterium]